MTPPLLSKARFELLERILHVGEQEGLECYLVGGFVRDLLLGQPVDDKDIDILVVGSANTFATSFAKNVGGQMKAFSAFHTAKVSGFSGFETCSEVDFASARTEVYEHPGSLPVVQPSDLSADLRRRDFTVNAIALPVSALVERKEEFLHLAGNDLGPIDLSERLEHVLVDPFGGFQDLRAQTLRILHDKSFVDDPTRIFRLYRYLSRLSFQIDEGTRQLLEQACKGDVFQTLTTERFWSEFKKNLAEPDPTDQLFQIHAIGAFRSHGQVFPPFQTISREWLRVYVQPLHGLTLDRRVELFVLLLIYSFWVTALKGEESKEVISEVQRVFSKLGIGRKKLTFFLSFFSDLLRGRYELQDSLAEVVKRYSGIR